MSSHLTPYLINTSTDYSYVVHYDVPNETIIEPLNVLTVNTLKINDIEETSGGNGVTVDGDVFLGNTNSFQVQTIQGFEDPDTHDPVPIDVLNPVEFSEGIQFGSSGTQLEIYQQGTFTAHFAGPIADTPVTVTLQLIGKLVTLKIAVFSAAYAGPAGRIIAAATTIPSSNPNLVPDASTGMNAVVLANGISVQGSIAVLTDGSIIINNGLFTGNFTT